MDRATASPLSDADRALLARVRRGDADALEALMGRYAPVAYRVAFAITRSAADAEEVVQDVFVTVCRKGEGFEGRAALSSWIYRVAANAALNKRRGRRREVERPLDEHLPAFLEDGHRAGERAWLLADWSQDPEAALLQGETRAALERAIEALPERHRAVLVLRDVEDLTNEQVADALGETVATVKARLHRARMALREQLTHHLTAS